MLFYVTNLKKKTYFIHFAGFHATTSHFWHNDRRCSVVVQPAAEINSSNENSNIRIPIFNVICWMEYKASDSGVSM